MSSRNQQGFVHLLAVLAVGTFGLWLVSSLIPVSRHYNNGKSNVAGVYLAEGGDDKKSSENSNRGSTSTGGSTQTTPNPGSGGSSSNKSPSTTSNSEPNKSSSTAISTPKPAKVENKEVETKVEMKEVSKPSRVETKTTPEKIKSEIRQGNLRIKFEVENGKVKIETKVKEGKNETELENEAENEAVKEVEAELGKEGVKVATAPGQIALVNKRVGALSSLPISVNPTTRQLTVTTPAGTKVVTVLPQQAINNMLAAKIMDDIVSEKVENNLASVPDLVQLETKNGVLGYKVNGTKTHQLLGFIPIKTGVTAFVSAENGQVVDSTQSLFGRILDRLVSP